MVKIILSAVKIPNFVIYHRGWNHLLTSLSSVEKLWYRAGLWKTGRQSEAGTWFLGPINGDRWVLYYKTKQNVDFFPKGSLIQPPFYTVCNFYQYTLYMLPSEMFHSIDMIIFFCTELWYSKKLLKRIQKLGFTPQIKEISTVSLEKGQLVHQKICWS